MYAFLIRYSVPFLGLVLLSARDVTAAVTTTANAISFSYPAGGNAASQQVTIDSTVGPISFNGVFGFGGVYFSVTPTSCTTPCTLTVSVQGGLPQVTYQDVLRLSYKDVSIAGSGAVFLQIPVTLTVLPAVSSVLTASQSAFSFASSTGSTQTVNIGSGGAPISFRVQSDSKWLSASPALGATPQAVAIMVMSAGLQPNVYTGNLTISDMTGVVQPLTITATLAVATANPNARALAHAADGDGFKTTVLLTNTDTAPASYTLRFNDDGGNLPSSGFELEAGSLSGIILPGRSATIRTAGLGTQIVNGWAELTAPSTVGGSVIYSQETMNLPTVQEGTAPIAAASQHFFLSFDNTNGAVTSIAITNPGTTTANLTITLRFDNGNSATMPWPAAPLTARTHQAFPLANWFPNATGQSGVAEFVADQPLSAVVFRFNTSGAFTALSVIPR